MVQFVSVSFVTTFIKCWRGKKFFVQWIFPFYRLKRPVDNQGFLSACLDALIFFMGKQVSKILEYLLIKQELGIGCIYIGKFVDICPVSWR